MCLAYTRTHTCPEWVANFIYTCPEVATNYMCPEWVVYQETNEWYPMGDKYIPWGSPRPARRVYIYMNRARAYISRGGIYMHIYLYITILPLFYPYFTVVVMYFLHFVAKKC